MLDQQKVFEELGKNGITFFAGVPDSYLNGFCNYALAHFPARCIIAANEGNAVGIAAGHWFASREIPLVYMQNSGQGNAVNPLASLADPAVYAVPVMLLIGWRGQGDTEPDHPQHKLQGEITPGLLELMHIPYTVLTDSPEDFARKARKAAEYCREHRGPYALLVPKGVMADPEKQDNTDTSCPMSREEAMEVILDRMPENTVFCATTGRATRELFFLREKRGEGKQRDFLNIGAMGHASSVALGIALERKDRPVAVLDGDAACIMHMGAMTMCSKLDVPNFLHIVLNNGAHESVGGQPSAGQLADLTKIAEACGYATTGRAVTTREELAEAVDSLRTAGRAAFIDCRIHKGIGGKLPPIRFDTRRAADDLADELNP